MGWMMLGMVLFWALLIFAGIWLVRLLFSGEPSEPAAPQRPIDVLTLRYRRGEITKEQYELMKKDLKA